MQAGGDPPTQLRGSLAAEGQDEDALGIYVARFYAVRDGFDNRGRLAGAGAGQHQQRAVLVLDYLLLGIVQARPSLDLPAGPYETVGGCFHRYRIPPLPSDILRPI
jgi:hypothetical protein